MQNAEKPFGRRALELMRAGPFRRFIVGSSISDTGTWMQVMAQAWVMSSLTNRATLLGMVTFASGLPTVALAMFGGSIADRYDKRKILIAAQVVQMILAAILGTLVLLGVIKVWHIIVLAGCLGICISFEMPAISALVPELVRRDQIATAIAIDRSVFHGSRLVGPSVAGLLVNGIGAAAAFFTNAVSFLALMIALMTLPRRVEGTAEEEEQRRSGFKEGLRLRAARSHHSLHDRTDRADDDFYLSIFVGHVAALRPQHSSSRRRSNGLSHGHLCRAVRSPASLGLLAIAPRQTFSFHGALRGRCRWRALLHVAFARASALTAFSMCVLAVALSTNFGLAGTIVQERAPARVARPHFRDFRFELFRAATRRRSAHSGLCRSGRSPHRAHGLVGYFRDRRRCLF